MSRPVFILVALVTVTPTPAADPPAPVSVGDVIDAAHRASRPAALLLLNRGIQLTPPSLRVGGLELQLRGVGGPYERIVQAALVAAGATPAPGMGGVVLVREAPLPPAAHVGVWVREKAGTRTTLTFTDRRLKIETEQAGKKVRLDADYAVSPDGVAFGVVMAAEPDDALAGELFKFRVRVEDGELTVREPRLTADGYDAKALLVGRYYTAGKDAATPRVRKSLPGTIPAADPGLPAPRPMPEQKQPGNVPTPPSRTS